MPSEPEISEQAPGGLDEKQLCLNCVFPNETEAHFCANCGAPLSSYAATGPFERIFAEGHVYRQAVEQPRSLVVVVGIWVIFGVPALLGVALLSFGRDNGFGSVLFGAVLLPISLVIIVKTTQNYFLGKKVMRNAPAEHAA